MSSSRNSKLVLTFCLCTALSASFSNGAEESAPATEAAQQETTAKQARIAFDEKFKEYKAAIRNIEKLRSDYQNADDEAKREKINAELTGHVAHAQTLVNALVEAAIESYRLAPKADPQIAELLKAVAEYNAAGRVRPGTTDQIEGGDQYEKALPIIKQLIAGGEKNQDLLLWGFVSAFATADYDLAGTYLQQLQATPPDDMISEPSAAKQNFFKLASGLAATLPEHRELWAKEAAIREAEAKADDLPRVKLTTSKGEITLELFENEAPQTVANFLTLVKQGFFEGSPFHRVLPGFMAQGGAKTDDGEGGPGYSIRGESTLPNSRKHFRGSLSMARRPNLPDSGSSQFFLTFVPTTHLDGEHTVFGRVIDGIEVLGDIQRRDPQQPNQPLPDRVINAEVLRDRGHEYAFEKLPVR